MKTFDERCDDIMAKIEVKVRQKKMRTGLIVSSCLLTAITALALFLFLPFNAAAPDMSDHASSPYYKLICKINEATYEAPLYKNNFDKLTSSLSGIKGDAVRDEMISIQGAQNWQDGSHLFGDPGSTPLGGTYQEVTDNQVEGVIEGDLFKRTDKYIYYLRDGMLYVYSIAKEDSKLVNRVDVKAGTTEGQMMESYFLYDRYTEMFLSEDGTTITIMDAAYNRVDETACVAVINLNVTDPENIYVAGQTFISGSSMTARMVDGDFLVMSKYAVDEKKIDFTKEETFVPQVGIPGKMSSIPAEHIVFPEELGDLKYTVVCKLDGKTLELQDAAAFLCYSDDIYVSKENVYATRSYTVREGGNDNGVSKTVTEISSVSYTGDKMRFNGSVIVEGAVKDQYSMDEFDGILRVVTSTNKTTTSTNGDTASLTLSRNVNLYCIDLATWEVAASVVGFAPENEQAESVRFDGYTAYVCTAEVVTLQDPVYYFDLSDLNNITWKDTGTIDGYSSSLVQLGDGYLMGIGYGSNRFLKIEIYRETEDGVTSVYSYEADMYFYDEYKSYLIDRENRLVGLLVVDHPTAEEFYMLLQFDGYELREIVKTPFKGNYVDTRAALIDGYLYMLGMEFKVEKVW